MPTKDKSGPRCAAIVGPYLSGKISLLESIFFACRRGKPQGHH